MANRKALFIDSGTLKEMPASDTTVGKRVLPFHFEAPANGTIPLLNYATFPFKIKQLHNLKTTSGTITVAVQINTTNVTSLSGLSASSTPQSPTASGANSVSIGNSVNLVLTSGSSPVGLQGTIDCEVE